MPSNPYALKPGEYLSLQALLNRYLDWKIWIWDHNLSDNTNQCDESLFQAFLCCQEHSDISHQSGDFYRYFTRLTFRPISGFSLYSLKEFILKYDLYPDQRKIAKAFHITEDFWASFMEEDLDADSKEE